MTQNRIKALLALAAAIVTFLAGWFAAPTDTTTVTKTVTTPAAEAPAAKTGTLPPQAPAVIATDGPDADAKADDPVAVSPAAAAVAKTLAVGAATGTNDLQPVEHGVPLTGNVAGQPVAQLEAPFASDSVPGCKTRTLTTNWSARAGGAQPTTWDLHFTAGPDVPNSRSDVDGLSVFGNQASARVSWHLNMDKDGNCDYNVPYREKAWTIAGLNSVSINTEVAGKGEAPYLRAGGYRELARIWIDMHRSYPAIKLRLAKYDGNCHVIVTGIGTHWMGGPCSGGHTDIHPLDIQRVISILRRYVAANHTTTARCRLIHEHRVTHKGSVANFKSRLAYIADAGLKCVGGHPRTA